MQYSVVVNDRELSVFCFYLSDFLEVVYFDGFTLLLDSWDATLLLLEGLAIVCAKSSIEIMSLAAVYRQDK